MPVVVIVVVVVVVIEKIVVANCDDSRAIRCISSVAVMGLLLNFLYQEFAPSWESFIFPGNNRYSIFL